MSNESHNSYKSLKEKVLRSNERCDLSALFKKSTRTNTPSDQRKRIHALNKTSIELDARTQNSLRDMCHKFSMTVDAVALVTLHELLSIYGNTSFTMLGIIKNKTDLLPSLIERNTSVQLFDTITRMKIHSENNADRILLTSDILMTPEPANKIFDCLYQFSRHDTDCISSIPVTQVIDSICSHPLLLQVYEGESEQCLKLTILYDAQAFDEETIQQLLVQAARIIDQISSGKIDRLDQLDLTNQSMVDIFNRWHAGIENIPEMNTTKMLHELFEDEVEKSKDKVAVVYEDTELTYQQLNNMSNHLGRHLRSLFDLKADDLIALFLDKSELMIVSILGVWKSGAAYVPIDPNYPEERIQFILDDTKAKLLITNTKYMERLSSYEICKVDVNSFFAQGCDGEQENLQLPYSVRNLAYVIYTSGTTGKPKGVMIEHRGVINLKVALTDLFNLRERPESVLSFSNYVFDHFVEQMTYAILNSHSLVVLNDTMRVDKPRLYEYLNRNKVTYLSGTPSVLRDYDFEQLQYLIRLDCIGEDFSEPVFDSMRTKFDGLIINGYGPTEISITSHKRPYTKGEKRQNKSIGRQLVNTTCYILNDFYNQVPIGAPGELYIGGIGVARGYLNRPDLNSLQFRQNPFQTQHERECGFNDRVYKTGDICRWLPNGEIEYLGRNDFQVKIRGLRIELGEIEAALSTFVGIEKAVVVAKEHKNRDTGTTSNKYLVGYYLADTDIEESTLKEYLSNKLPEYMVPNRLVKIDKIPVNISGKLDSKALPDVVFNIDQENYQAPRNDLEKVLCDLWSDLLGLEKVGINDDFFKLGGDSIGSLHMISRVQKDLRVSIRAKDIVSLNTVRRLATSLMERGVGSHLEKSNQRSVADYPQKNQAGVLLPIQKWFFLKGLVNLNHWNQAFLIETPNLNIETLRNALERLVQYHDVFKCRFKKNSDGQFIQWYDSDSWAIKQLKLNVMDLAQVVDGQHREELLNETLTKWQSDFDVENGPLFSVGYLTGLQNGKAQIWFAIHHLIIDSVSWRIICDDLWKFYEGSSYSGIKGTSYLHWSELINSYGQKKSMTEGIYWRNVVRHVADFNALLMVEASKSDYNVPSEVNFSFNTKETSILLRDCPHAYGAHINVLLLTALGHALKSLSQCRNNYVTIEGHGREEIDGENVDVSRTIGWFTTMYPVLLEIDHDFIVSIRNVRGHLREVPNNGIGYGTIIGYENQELPKVTFNYLGQFEKASANRPFRERNVQKWYLTQGIVGNAMLEEYHDYNRGDLISVNGMSMEGQLRFDIMSKLGSERTNEFTYIFKSTLEEIIKNCFSVKLTDEVDYYQDFENPFILLNADCEKTLFVLPPGSGNAESYLNNIVPCLFNYKLVLFNNYYHNLKLKNMEKGLTFEMVARLYRKYIKLIQPQGSYNFIGWSYGGVLSFEIARQMTNAGDVVKNVFMIDSFFNMKETIKHIDNKPETDVVGEINELYAVNIENETFASTISNMYVNLVLFKAESLDEAPLLGTLLPIYEYYCKTEFNELDTIVHPKFIRLIKMNGDTHHSWVSNKERVKSMCIYISSVIQ